MAKHHSSLVNVFNVMGISLLAGGIAWGLASLISRESEQEPISISDLYAQAVSISAGDDNYWSSQEKARFLKENGINTILQDGEWMYMDTFSVNSVSVYSSSQFQHDRFIGSITRSQLEKYINEHQKPEPLLEAEDKSKIQN